MSEKKSVSDRIERAFVELMAEKYYTDITVTEIVRRAGVSRVSFYRHYSSTADILDNLVSTSLSRLSGNFAQLLQSRDTQRWKEFLTQFTCAMSDACETLKGCLSENQAVIQNHLTQRVIRLFHESSRQSISEKYTPLLLLSSLCAAVLAWFNTGKEESAAQLVDYLLTVVTAFGSLAAQPAPAQKQETAGKA